MKILIIKTSSLGDIIHAFPSLHYLRSKFPEAEIDWVVEKSFSDIVRAHPAVNDVYCVDTQTWRKNVWSKTNGSGIVQFFTTLRSKKYDVIFDLQGNSKSAMIGLMAKGKTKVGFGYKTVSEFPNLLTTSKRFDPPTGLNICADYLYLVQSFFEDNVPHRSEGVALKISVEQEQVLQAILQDTRIKNGKKWMICPGSAWKNKQVEPKALAEFLKYLYIDFKCAFLFAWGNNEEREMVIELQKLFPDNSIIIDRLPLPVLQNLMGKMEYVIAMDSLPLHLAGTTSARTFSVFGPSLAMKFKPEGSRHRFIQGTCPYGRTFLKRCPILRTCSTGSCIRDLTGRDLYQSFRQQDV